MFKIMINHRTEFSVIGITSHDGAKFQALMNGVPFAQSPDYEKMRSTVINAVELNKKNKEHMN